MRSVATTISAVAVCLSVWFTVGASQASAQGGGHLGNVGGGEVDTPPPPRSSGACDGNGACFAGVEAGDSTGGPGSGMDPCTYTVGDFDTVVAHFETYLFAYPGAFGEGPPADPAVYAHPWVIIYCPYSPYTDAAVLWGLQQLGDPPDPAVMARVAEQSVVLPVPVPQFSPDVADFQVVGIETWLWLDDAQTAPVVRTACIPPLDYACVEIVATFVDISADMADGSEPFICDGNGTPYDSAISFEIQRDLPHCGHVYTASPPDAATYPARVASTWHVTYRCFYDSDLDGSYDSGCGGGALGLIGRISDPQPLEVRDLQAVATPG